MKKDVEQLIENNYQRLVDRITSDATGEQLADFIKFTKQFWKYSWRNCCMIYSQCPNASYVTGYRTWQKLGRQERCYRRL